jgi:GNAT superfamily N-acetyltransferase
MKVTATSAGVVSLSAMSLGAFTRIDVTRTHLELRSLDALRPVLPPSVPATLRRLDPIRAAEYRALYTLVGERWLWRDRLVWTDEELDAYLSAPDVHVWLLSVGGATAGYFELKDHGSDAAEVMYFGLAPTFMGRGLGGWMLTRAVEEAFALGTRRVVLNTCTLDAPQALPNYLARGFSIVREERYLLEVPAPSA